jgi:hypothetical protein
VTAPCPPWCDRDHSGDSDAALYVSHSRQIGRAGDAWVSLAQTSLWPRPMILLSYYSPGGPVAAAPHSNAFLPRDEAAGMAGFLVALGHEDIAALIRQAAEASKTAPATADGTTTHDH